MDARQGLSEAQQRAVQLVAAGVQGKDIASELGVTAETVSRWRQTTPFQAAVNRELWELRRAVRERIAALCAKALDVISETLDSPAAPSNERLRAAFKVLDTFGASDVAQTPPGPMDATELDMLAKLEPWGKAPPD